MKRRYALHILWIGLIATACSSAPVAERHGPVHDACARGDQQACHDFAEQNEQGTAEESRRALVAYQYGCLLQHQPSCAGLARMYGEEHAGAEDRMVDAMRSACEAGESEGCVQLAQHSNRVAARRLLEKACDADYGPGCHELAELIRRGWMVEANMVEAVKLDEKACELGEPDGCVGAGKAYLFGSGAVQDTERGLELLGATCTDETAVGCRALAKIWEEGIGVEADIAKASEYYDRAEKHLAAQKKPTPATAYIVFVDACAHGDVLGCFNAGWFRAEGAEVPRNVTLSREFFQQACRAGLSTACERWEKVQPSDQALLAEERSVPTRKEAQ